MTTTVPNGVLAFDGGALSGFRNRIINGNFGINQRAVSGTVTLAAGIYGHDRWKAGAGGCTYTFATALNVTTLTISAGTLQQVIEGANLFSGAMKLSWTGTAQGRVDSGAYGASGVVGTAVGGTNQTIEFNTGTVSLVQYESGSVATPFEQRPIGTELVLCQWYYYSSYPVGVSPNGNSGTLSGTHQTIAVDTTSAVACGGMFKQTMRSSPTVTIYAAAGGGGAQSARDNTSGTILTGITINAVSANGLAYISKAAALTAGRSYGFEMTANAEL